MWSSAESSEQGHVGKCFTVLACCSVDPCSVASPPAGEYGGLEVAVKRTFATMLGGTKEDLEEFASEISVLVHLTHPNIVT